MVDEKKGRVPINPPLSTSFAISDERSLKASSN